jgi:signal peptidase II
MKPRLAGGLLALAVLAADQASKLWLLHGLKMVEGERIVLTPFFDLYLRWNTGISYSLFQQATAGGRWALLGVTLLATVLLAIWLWRTSGLVAALALGAIIGGALGNAYDRFAYGAVADFCDFHIFGWRPFVFNIADTAITLGVLLLVYDGLLASGRGKPAPARLERS